MAELFTSFKQSEVWTLSPAKCAATSVVLQEQNTLLPSLTVSNNARNSKKQSEAACNVCLSFQHYDSNVHPSLINALHSVLIIASVASSARRHLRVTWLRLYSAQIHCGLQCFLGMKRFGMWTGLLLDLTQQGNDQGSRCLCRIWWLGKRTPAEL